MVHRRLNAQAQRTNLRWLVPLFALVGFVGCISAPLPTSTPVATPTPKPTATSTPRPAQPTSTSTAVASPTPLPTPTATSTPSPTPTPTVPIVVNIPASREKISSPVRISGGARVFEGQLAFAIKDAQGKVLAEGSVLASAGAPEWGTFAADVSFKAPALEQAGTVEVFTRSPKDGSVQNLVIIPVILLPK